MTPSLKCNISYIFNPKTNSFSNLFNRQYVEGARDGALNEAVG